MSTEPQGSYVHQPSDDGLMRSDPLPWPMAIGEQVWLSVNGRPGLHTLVGDDGAAWLWRCDHD